MALSVQKQIITMRCSGCILRKVGLATIHFSMKFEDLPSYQQILADLTKKRRKIHLLFGNGFSMAYDRNIFSYNALSTFIEKVDDDLLKKLFHTLDTKNFEVIMQQLDTFAEIAKIFSTDSTLVLRINQASEKLKRSLIDAVKELHPEHVFTIPEAACTNCYAFLDRYLSNEGLIFSTNYDLLPYWVLMRNKSPHANDGFGKDLENATGEYIPEDELQYSEELRWGKRKQDQTIYYLHGTLPFFDNGIDIVKEVYSTENFLLQNISNRMEKKEYPIFVTAGNGKQKLTHIMHNKYLSHYFDKFSSIEGSLVTFGFNFSEQDSHIIDGINKAAHFGKREGDKLQSIYIGVFSQQGLEYIESIRGKFKCKVNLYNSQTTNIW